MSVNNDMQLDAHLPKEQLAASLREFLPHAAKLARVPVSGFRVGAAALGASGHVWLGANQEFAGAPLNFTVHAEQAAVINARAHGETALLMLAVSAAPCGYCRQFLRELKRPLDIALNGRIMPLDSLLPEAFALGDPGSGQETLLNGLPQVYFDDDPLRAPARNAALNSYSPYTGTKSGVALRCASGRIFSGSLIECAAYNPSLSALQSALTLRALDGSADDPIDVAVLAEQPGLAVFGDLFWEMMRLIEPDAAAQRLVFEEADDHDR
ncbi:MAG: cytidine deaminase [Pyramidobacter sp.]|nr:cytidine deaminase [Pyramidobacter sp.]